MKNKIAIYPGTFDPPTLGHLNVIKRAAVIFDHLIVAVGINLAKKAAFFSTEERISYLQTITKFIPNVEISSFNGLLIDFAKEKDCHLIIRGIRNFIDLEKESFQAQMNRQLSGIETFFITVDEKYRHVSSTLVREIATFGKRLNGIVPNEIEDQIFQRLIQLSFKS